jgi:hypothetical protein
MAKPVKAANGRKHHFAVAVIATSTWVAYTVLITIGSVACSRATTTRITEPEPTIADTAALPEHPDQTEVSPSEPQAAEIDWEGLQAIFDAVPDEALLPCVQGRNRPALCPRVLLQGQRIL